MQIPGLHGLTAHKVYQLFSLLKKVASSYLAVSSLPHRSEAVFFSVALSVISESLHRRPRFSQGVALCAARTFLPSFEER
jgi:hypothetical protein